MKPIIALCLLAQCCSAVAGAPQPQADANLLPALRPYVKDVAAELALVSAERKVVLNEIAASIASRLERENEANVTFICTHNSRRSHMSQIWLQTAACFYGFDKVYAWSGGTDVTACNCRTITAMRRVGFDIKDATGKAIKVALKDAPKDENPLYLVRYAENRSPIRAYSKRYDADANPKRDFIALMTCSSADKSCPVVEGAIARYAIHYADPRLCDDTPTETTAYNERCREIAREMFYIMSVVRRRIGEPGQR